LRVILTLDRHISAFSGRPSGLQDEELVSFFLRFLLTLQAPHRLIDGLSLYFTIALHSFDLDPLTECDDEYWEDRFTQPPGQPSAISYFNSYLRLMDIMACAMRLIVGYRHFCPLIRPLVTSPNELLSFSTQYSVKRPENLFDKSSPRSDQKIIAELDSMMNKWMDSVPAHRESRTPSLPFLRPSHHDVLSKMESGYQE